MAVFEAKVSCKIFKEKGVSISTLQDWKQKERDDYRRVLYDMLKNMSE